MDFFVVGAPKAGSTYLSDLLKQNPFIFVPHVKEPTFFCPDVRNSLEDEQIKHVNISENEIVTQRCQNFHTAFISDIENYERLFVDAKSRIRGDFSTFYMSSSSAPRLIYEYNPEAKVIFMLREPKRRIQSHYKMDLYIGNTKKSLEKLLNEEMRMGNHAFWGNCRYYIGATRYSRHIQNYARYFRQSQIYVCFFEHLTRDPQSECEKICDFLGAPSHKIKPELATRNSAQRVRFPVLNNFLFTTGAKAFVKNRIKNRLPSNLKKALRDIYFAPDDFKIQAELNNTAELICAEEREWVRQKFGSHPWSKSI